MIDYAMEMLPSRDLIERASEEVLDVAANAVGTLALLGLATAIGLGRRWS